MAVFSDMGKGAIQHHRRADGNTKTSEGLFLGPARCCQPNRVLRLAYNSGSKSESALNNLDFRSLEKVSIDFQKQSCRHEACPFISVNKGMIFDDSHCVGCRDFRHGRRAVVKKMPRAIQRRFQQPFIPDSFKPSKLVQQFIVKCQTIGNLNPKRIAHFASSLKAFLYRRMRLPATSIFSLKPGCSGVTRSEFCGVSVRYNVAPSSTFKAASASLGSTIPREFPIFRTLVSIAM